jgi:hypothetical protein
MTQPSIRPFASNSWVATPTHRQSCALEEEIDQRVHALYEPSAEEIKITEEGKE